MSELGKLIRAKPSSSDLNSDIITISAWPTRLVHESNDIEEILEIACEVIQDASKLPGTAVEVLPSF